MSPIAVTIARDAVTTIADVANNPAF